MKGAFAHATFNVNSPSFKKDVLQFFGKVDEAKRQQGIKALVAMKKMLSSTSMEIVFIAAAKSLAIAGELEAKGYISSGEINDFGKLPTAFKEFDFSNSVSFDKKPTKKQ
ncbi:MAG: hypothetical protein ACAI44_07845 [Candidatus Sericytochromatia bacterium]